MKQAANLRLFGGVILLFNLWLTGRYDIGGVPSFLLSFGFAIGYEYLVVRPLSKAGKEARRKTAYPIPEKQQQNEEFIALLKSAVNENRLDMLPDKDLLEICKRARAIDAPRKQRDDGLSRAINIFFVESQKRGLLDDNVLLEPPPEYPKAKNKTFYAILGVMVFILLIIVMIRVQSTRFIDNKNGTVSQMRTGLMWAALDNGTAIEWQEAKSYCENYRGCGYTDWRMPTQDELTGLYDKAKTYKVDGRYDVHLTELIRLSSTMIWASETSGTAAASFNFKAGIGGWFHLRDRSQSVSTYSIGSALPVRSEK